MSDGPQPPLDYRNPDDDRGPEWRSRLAGGVVVAGAVTAFVGFILYFATFDTFPRHGPPDRWPPIIGFAVAAAVAGVGIALLPRRTRRTYLLGCLIGLLVVSLMEGLCFFGS